MLYLIGGDNLYQSSQRLEELKEEFLNRFNGVIQIINADEINNFQEVVNNVESISLFNQEKLLIIKRLQQSKKFIQEQALDFLQSTKNYNLIFWENRALDKRKRIYKFIKKKGVVEEFNKLGYAQLKSWLSRFIGERVDCEPIAVDDLLYKVGDSQMQLSYTASNLIDLVKARGQRKLQREHIEMFVDKTTEENIWEFIDAISESNKAKALDITERFLREKGDFVMIVGMLARQFRILSLVKFLTEKKKNFAEISSTLKLHPFVIRKALIHCKNFTFTQLRKLYKKLVKTDLVVKQGRFEEKLALDLLIAAI
jgi:DNA polymerase-3 subunit delta